MGYRLARFGNFLNDCIASTSEWLNAVFNRPVGSAPPVKPGDEITFFKVGVKLAVAALIIYVAIMVVVGGYSPAAPDRPFELHKNAEWVVIGWLFGFSCLGVAGLFGISAKREHDRHQNFLDRQRRISHLLGQQPYGRSDSQLPPFSPGPYEPRPTAPAHLPAAPQARSDDPTARETITRETTTTETTTRDSFTREVQVRETIMRERAAPQRIPESRSVCSVRLAPSPFPNDKPAAMIWGFGLQGVAGDYPGHGAPCVPACVAMLLRTDYVTACRLLLNEGLIEPDNVLYAGCTLASVMPVIEAGGWRRDDLYPEIALCTVMVPSGGYHAVILLPDRTCLDPAEQHRRPSLSEYHAVVETIGLRRRT